MPKKRKRKSELTFKDEIRGQVQQIQRVLNKTTETENPKKIERYALEIQQIAGMLHTKAINKKIEEWAQRNF